MDPAEAAEWERLNAILPASNRAADPCEDCTVRFAVEMRLVGRCDSWPTTPVGGRPVTGEAPAKWPMGGWRTPYSSDEERIAGRRASWRAAAQRRRERARAVA